MPSSIEDTNRTLALEALLSEYNALYGLAQLRLLALDRRIPIVGGLLTAFLSSVPVLPGLSQILALMAVPVSLIWLVRTTINHARSFEDAIRGIEHKEHQINKLLSQDLIGFQRTHPSRGNTVGGRTGSETVWAVMLASGLLLAMSLVMVFSMYMEHRIMIVLFGGYILGIVALLGRSLLGWRAYRYQTNAQSQ